MKLDELPRGAKLLVRVTGKAEKEAATFHRIDGSYSLCTLDAPGRFEDRAFHLHASEEMIQVGEHFELAPAATDPCDCPSTDAEACQSARVGRNSPEGDPFHDDERCACRCHGVKS